MFSLRVKRQEYIQDDRFLLECNDKWQTLIFVPLKLFYNKIFKESYHDVLPLSWYDH